MKCMVLMKASPSSEAGVIPSERLLTDMASFNEELMSAGIILSGEGLHPSSAGIRVHFGADEPQIEPGPFAETSELISGFWIWQVSSMDDAIQWAKRIPNTDGVHRNVELRPLFEAEDFGEEFTPALRQQEDRLRDAIQQQQQQQ
ncbi:YciI family protein [Zhongshania sp. BJYM1]|uniref:YciI family protein n=1 Tax=Zhongshania aquatica TaxID=2965069 RepID=UPI0022B5A587|nr:YciI family protein [Marortus sp. BJYM1]